MAAGTLVRKVMMTITGDSADAEEKLQAITDKANELREMHPELVPMVDKAEAMANLQVIKDELKELAAAADETPMEIRVTSAEAQAKIDSIKASAEELRAMNPTIIPKINDMEASAQLAVLRGEMVETEEQESMLSKGWEVGKYALLGLAGALGFGVYKAAGFNQAMLLLHTQAGVSTQTMNTMSSGVLKMAGQLGQGPDSLAEAAYHVASNMASMGATTTQMLGAVRIAAEGASVGQANLVDVTNSLGAAIASGIKGTQDYQAAMGAMNATVGAGDMTMQDLADAFGHGTLANMKLYGATLTDVGAILATFGDNNLRGAAAGTQMRMSIQALAVQAATAGPALAKLGLTSTSLGNEMKSHGAVAAINLLIARMKAAGVTSAEEGNIVTELFGKKAGAGIGVLVDQVDRLNSKVPVLIKGAHDFNAAWQAQQNSPAQKMKDLESGSEALAINLGQHLLPVATKVIGWLSSFVNGLEGGSAAAESIAGVIGGVLGLIALKKLEDGLEGAFNAMQKLWSAGKTLISWGGQMVTKLMALRGAQAEAAVATDAEAEAQEGANVAMDANPIGAITLLIAGLGVGIYELVKHWKTVSKTVSEVFHDVEHWVGEGISWIKGHWPLIVGIFLGPFPFIIAELAQHWRQVLHGVETVYHDVTGWFRRLPGAILAAVGDLGHLLWDAGTDVIKGLLGGVTSMIGDVESTMKGIGGDIEGGIKDVLGIFSPSKVMRQHGQMIGLGLELGIEDTYNQVTAAGRHLALAAEGGSASGRSGAGQTIKIELEWVGGNMDSALWTLMKRNIRIRGGDPTVLGR